MRISDWSSDVCSSDLHSAEREHLEKVRDLATKVGITTYSVTSQSRKGYLAEETDIFRIYFDARSLSEEMLLKSTANERFRGLRKMHGRLGWRINAVEQTDRVEQVYCAEEKGTHAFALDDNIRSEEHTSELQSLKRTPYDVICSNKQ